MLRMKDKDGNLLNICKGCKENRNKHDDVLSSEKWALDCTLEEKTDAFGEIKFSSSFTNKAKVIKCKFNVKLIGKTIE